jgi:L-ascorbate metabolism protein UlaG (beta-lactamase superfamily)
VELQYFGANCLRLTTKKASIVVDDNLEKLGLKPVTKPTDINLRTSTEIPTYPSRFTADMPGEYELSGVVIHGMPARGHMDEEGKKTAVMYTVESDGVKVLIVGHIYPDLSEEQTEQIGLIDIAVVPVGGNGYTLDGVGALKLIKKVEPKVVIPVHYADKALKYEVPQAELADVLKNMGIEPTEKVAGYKFKPAEVTDTTHLVVLERQ